MSAFQVLNLFLNPFAGRANRQQFLFFVLIFCVLYKLFDIASAVQPAIRQHYSDLEILSVSIGLYFLFIGISRRLRDFGFEIFENFLIFTRTAAIYLFYTFLILIIFITFFTIVAAPAMFVILGTAFWCSTAYPDCLPHLKFFFAHFYIFPDIILLFLVLAPLLAKNNSSWNLYGPPPVAFDLRTMLASTYPAHLKNSTPEEGEDA